jgi:hypothetical protein
MASPNPHLESKPVQLDSPEAVESEPWRRLVGKLGAEVAGPLTAALEKINALVTSGHIDGLGLRSLRAEVEVARQVGMTAQLISRFANGKLVQSRERVPLSDVLQNVLSQRSRETVARGISVRPLLQPADVVVDASLAFSLLNTLIDWVSTHAKTPITFTIDVRSWARRARLICRFDRVSGADYRTGNTPTQDDAFDSLTWRLLEQTARAMKVGLSRQVVERSVSVSIDFDLAVMANLDGADALELDQGFDSSMNSKPLAGSHVVVVASRREVRLRVRDAIRHMGLIVDLVSSVKEAADFCKDGLPHAIIFEGILKGEQLDRFCDEILQEVPGFSFIEIVEEGKGFGVSDKVRHERAVVGQDAIEGALPSVLMFELSKSL